LLLLLQQNNKRYMALVSKKDFAEALNISYGTIRSKVSRKQLCCNRKGLIDTENPKNYIYLLEINGGDQSVFEKFRVDSKSLTNVNKKITLPRQTEKKVIVSKTIPKKQSKISESGDFEKVNDSEGSVNSSPTVETQKTTKKIIKETAPVLSVEERKIMLEQKKHNQVLLDFEKRKREAEVKLIERNAELKQWELEKKAGNTLPLDMIEKVIGINYKAVFKSIHSQTKNIAMVMVQKLGGSKDDLNSIMIELENILDKTVKDAEKKSNVDIEKLIDEYSEIRSRGERKV
jgi:hypothetical protein